MTTGFEVPWHGVATAGSLSLSFVNTLDWRLREPPVELLHTYTDFLRWAWTAGAVERSEARALLRWESREPRSAGRVLADAKETREAFAAALAAATSGRSLPEGPLAELDAVCRAARRAQALRSARGSAVWVWREEEPEPQRPLWAAVLDATGLLTSAELARVRQCGDAACGWYFLDTSRNRSRRWCSMEGCGNRNKARAFYQRSTRSSTP